MKLGVVTGGSDCQGLNAAVRAIVKTARNKYDWEVIAFEQGWRGVLDSQFIPVELADVSGILLTGGTFLGTSRTNPSRIENGYETIVSNLKKIGIDALLLLGGRAALSVGSHVADLGFPLVAIPATVDNDIGRTDFSIGFQSAVSVVMKAADDLHSTASSHHRVMILEVMGRDTGWVALYGGIAGGADWIIIPEVQTRLAEISAHLKKRRKQGKVYSIIVTAEGATLPEIPVADVREADEFGRIRMDKRNVGARIGNELEKMTGFEVRITVLGHLQRGGPPVAADRILATRMGIEAVELVKKKKFNKMVTFNGDAYGSENLARILKETPRMVPIDFYSRARILY